MSPTIAAPEDDLPAGYPKAWEADVVLRDGTVAQVRPILPSDTEALHRFHEAQSEESIYLRFFVPLKRISDRDARRFTHVDYIARAALVLTVEDELVGIARYDRLNGPEDTTAEVAFNVSDRFQGRGVGSVLLEHLAAVGQERGVGRFVADVLPQNRKMLSVFTEAGFEVQRHYDDGLVALNFDIRPTENSEQVRAAREQRSESVSVRALLSPRSVAVIGVSRRTDSAGRILWRNILAGGFNGTVHAVTREGTELDGHPTLAEIDALPSPLDLAIIAVPAESVIEVVRGCARRGTRSLMVLSSGFAEAGPEGEARQRELLQTARRHGMRVLGPTSFGVINNRHDVQLNATLAPRVPPLGRMALFAQSGALGIAVLQMMDDRGLGLSDFVSAGNRVDVSGNDLMQYWLDVDNDTAAVGLYLESMGNPRKFSRIARRLAAAKPVIVVKSDLSAAGVPPGHRVRITQARPEAFRAMLRQAGVIRVASVHQLLDVAQLVVHQPIPRGPRVAVVGNSDALGVLAADAAVSRGLDVVHGPVVLGAEADLAEFATALTAAFRDEDVDSVIACFIPALATEGLEVARLLIRTSAGYDKPCVSTFLGVHGVVEELDGATAGEAAHRVPSYAMPEDAVRALAAATRYGQWRSRDRGVLVRPENTDRVAAERLIQRVLTDVPTGRRCSAEETTALLGSYGISCWPLIRVEGPDQAAHAAHTLGYPVVLKSISPLVRLQPVTGLRADITTEAALRETYATLDERLAPLHANRFVVQRMAPPGVACVLGSAEDPLFGPVVRFSLSGPPTELLEDIGYRIPPLTDVDCADLIGSVKASPLLFGYRGAAPVDRPALEDLVARVSMLADQHPQIAHLELNPVNCHPGGVEVLGAEIVLAPPVRRTDTGRRSLG